MVTHVMATHVMATHVMATHVMATLVMSPDPDPKLPSRILIWIKPILVEYLDLLN
jgi:hypothetical protein